MNDELIYEKINFALPTAFLIHGWFDSANRTWINKTMVEYTKRIDSNICAVDWSRLAETEYTIAAGHTKLVAGYLVQFIQFLQRYGLKLKNVTIIGHSFGAQIAGLVGRQFNGKIGQIYGLDPAGWLYTKPNIVSLDARLDKSDAKFVQCIHTSVHFFSLGSHLNCGHQDFYPNDGQIPQPGCLDPSTGSGMTHCMFYDNF